MTMSFRLRIFVTAAVIVATVVGIVLSTGWSRIVVFEVRRLDDTLCSEAKRLTVERFEGDEMPRLAVDILRKLHLTDPDQLLLHFRDSHSGRTYQSDRWFAAPDLEALPWKPVGGELRQQSPEPPIGRLRPQPRSECSLASMSLDGDEWRIARSDETDARGEVAANLAAPREEIQRALFSALLTEIPISLVLTAVGAWLLSTFVMRPLNRLRESMRSITPNALDRRLPWTSEDQEFRELIQAYNTMLERLQKSFEQASRFSADAAHELKTPLTILRGRLEQARRKATDEATRADLSALIDEVGSLTTIIRKLLLLSQADSGKLELSLESVNLTVLLAEMTDDFQLMVDEGRLVTVVAPHLIVRGDMALLRQLINNLLSNCVRYSTPSGVIRVTGSVKDGACVITIANPSRSIPASERERFFERFFRGDPSHNRKIEGNGLGLSLALEIAKAHRGSLMLLPTTDTEVCLQLTLPRE